MSSVWFGLYLREIVTLLLLGALGSAFVVSLRELSVVSRLAIAPVFGLAFGSTIMITANYFIPAKTTAFAVFIPMVVLSLGIAMWLYRRKRSRNIRLKWSWSILQLPLIIVVLLFALNYPLAVRDSLGPHGFRIGDAAGYVAVGDGNKDHTPRQSREEWAPVWDKTADYAHGYLNGFQHTGSDTITSNVGVIFGWSTSELHSSFMAVLILVGALGVFSAVCYLTNSRHWLATFSSLFYAGPMTYQLFLDASQGALAGLSLIVPTALLALVAWRERKLKLYFLIAVLLAGMLSVYPIYITQFGLGVFIVLFYLFIKALDKWRGTVSNSVKLLGVLAIVTIITITLSPVATARAWRYFKALADSAYLDAITVGLPQYPIPDYAVPSYVFQTHELYYLTDPTNVISSEIFVTFVWPLVLLGVCAYGVWRYRMTVAYIPFLLAAIIIVSYTWTTREECTYCVVRNLLIFAPYMSVFVGVGVIALFKQRRLPWIIASIIVMVTTIAIAGQRDYVLARRMTSDGHLTPRSADYVIDGLKGRKGSVYLEGVGASYNTAYEMPSFYHRIRFEAKQMRIAISIENDKSAGTAYLGGTKKVYGPEYTPDYEYVFTRIGSVKTNRKTLRRSDAFALQARKGVDVTVTEGVIIDHPWRDRNGYAWVVEPLKFWVSSPTDRTVWLRLTFKGPAARTARFAGPGRASTKHSRSKFIVCKKIKGPVGLRRVKIKIKSKKYPPGPNSKYFVRPHPPKGLRLYAMSASTKPCAK